jgi:catalase
VSGHVVRQPISRINDYGQAGDRYRAFSDWERNELIANLVAQLTPCRLDIQERMIEHFTRCDADYGRRVAEGLCLPLADISRMAAD